MKYLKRLMMIPAMPAIVIIGFTSPEAPDAYLDAGTGSMIIYAIVGAAAGILLAVKMFWSKIRLFFRNLFSKGKTHEGFDD